MKKVFEPGEIELADPRGDPNRVIEIQSKIKELLEANRQRQQGIRDEILADGAWAIPGVLNATYVWMNHLDNNEPAKEIIAELLANLARENDSAVNLLVDSGVLENPFKTPREIVLQALDKLNWKPAVGDINKISAQIKNQKKTGDIEGLLLSFHLLAQSGDKKQLELILQQAADWSAKNMDAGPKLLRILIKYYPDEAEKILTKVFEDTEHLYNEKNLAKKLVEAVRPIPLSWWLDNIIINISVDVLEQCNPPRHTAVEYLWENAAQDVKNELDRETLNELNEQILQVTEKLEDDVANQIVRYWFKAQAKSLETLDVIIVSAFSQHEVWATQAAAQFFFIKNQEPKVYKKHKEALDNALTRLANENSARYQRAQDLFETISSKKKQIAEVKATSNAATLTEI